MQLLKWIDSWKGVLVVHAGVFFLILAPYLIGGQMLAQNADTHLTNYPLMTLFVERFGSLDFLWNDLNFHGFPMGLGFPFQYHLPLYFLAPILSAISVLNWAVYLTVVAAAFLFSQLLRRYEVSSYGSVLSGLAYGVSAWFWMFDLTILSMLLLLPCLIYAIENSLKKRLLWTFIGGLIVGYAWLTLHFQFTIILLSAGGLVVLARCYQKKIGAAISYIAMVGIGTLIGLVRLLPTLAYGHLSERSTMSFVEATAGGTLGTAYPLRFLFPELRIPLLSGSGGGFDPYIGPMFVFLAITGAVATYKKSTTRFLLIVIGLILLLTIPHSPLYYLLFQIPPFSFLRYPTRWLILINIAVAALVGIGLDAVSKGAGGRVSKMLPRLFLWVGGVVAMGSVLISTLSVAPAAIQHMATSWMLPWFPHHTEESLIKVVADVYGAGNNHMTAALGLLITGLVLRSGSKKASRIDPHKFLLISIGIFLFVFIPRSYVLGIDRSAYLEPAETMQYIQAAGGVYFAPLPESVVQKKLQAVHGNIDREEIRLVLRSLGLASYNLYDQIESADLYDRLAAKRMARLLAAIGSQRASVTADREIAYLDLSVEEKLEKIANHRYIFDILNIQHIVSGWPMGGMKFTKEYTEEASSYKIPISVYSNPTARPFAYFAEDVVFQDRSPEDAEAFILSESWPSSRTLVECEECAGEERFTAQGEVKVLIREPRQTQIQTSSDREQWIVISQNYLPGWSVKLDGEEVIPSLAHGTFVAIFLEEGTHEIDLQFSFSRLLIDSARSVFLGDDSIWGG